MVFEEIKELKSPIICMPLFPLSVFNSTPGNTIKSFPLASSMTSSMPFIIWWSVIAMTDNFSFIASSTISFADALQLLSQS